MPYLDETPSKTLPERQYRISGHWGSPRGHGGPPGENPGQGRRNEFAPRTRGSTARLALPMQTGHVRPEDTGVHLNSPRVLYTQSSSPRGHGGPPRLTVTP